ncbi:MAG: hypothetical protein JRI97_09115 [Deltaproteobacteria bacterium]|nr:hypothetical protein [Deltaproteobacteria bacterium]
MATWKCTHCGYTLEAEAFPEPCPSCHQPCEFVDVTCYVPACQDTGQDERLGKPHGLEPTQTKVPPEK